MTKLYCCRFCVVEMARVALADGTAALICLDCDAIGLEHEIAGGAPMSPAGLAAAAKAEKTRHQRLRSGRGGAAHGR
ncbi:MAG: hypothetical protein WBW74_12905 [Xanthobacteraceae bacterium]